jgi:CBS-domain-containing membrane protein
VRLVVIALGLRDDQRVKAIVLRSVPCVDPSATIANLEPLIGEWDGQQHVLVTTLGGRLIGLARRDVLDATRHRRAVARLLALERRDSPRDLLRNAVSAEAIAFRAR